MFVLALIVWNELQVIKPDTVGVWNDYLGRSDSKKFKAAKERIEQEVCWLNII